MRATAAAAAATLALLAGGLQACAPAQASPEYAGICVDETGGTRIDDDYCDRDESEFGDVAAAVWFYMLLSSNNRIPGVGERYTASHGVYKLPSGKRAKYGMPRGGTTTSEVRKKVEGSGGSTKKPSGGKSKPRFGGGSSKRR